MKNGYAERLAAIEAVLAAALDSPGGGGSDCAAPEMTRYLCDPARDMVARGGKRWRPLLMTLVCEAFDGGDAALPLAPLVEFAHNASLIHDDIEDGSPERRGKPAVHVLYGLDRAINTGSFLYFLAASCIEGWDPARTGAKHAAYTLWAEHLRRLHLGQAMDIAWHRGEAPLPDIAGYDLMCRLKTGSLARLAVFLGVLAAGREDWERAAAPTAAAAETLGLGFQILDDVKNLTTGNPGKKRGDDIVEGKISLPVLLFLRRFPEKADFVARCFARAREGGVEAPEVDLLAGEMAGAGSVAEAARRGEALVAEAGSVLAAKGPLLAGFADLLRQGAGEDAGKVRAGHNPALPPFPA